MNYEIIDCIDAGTEYCPCHLAETGQCLLCSQLQGKKFCDCKNWKGTCIMQEYFWNGKKAKEGRKTYLCTICDKEKIEEDLYTLTIKTTHKLAEKLVRPGSFVFLRNPNSEIFFDAPISIMETNLKENTIKVCFEIKGIKTKRISELGINDAIFVKGPFWNGVLGIKNIYKSTNGHSVIISRGIGQGPMIPVMKKLYSNGNKITLINDKGKYHNNFIKQYLKTYKPNVIDCITLNKGELSNDLKVVLSELFLDPKLNMIHCSGPDILIYKVLKYINNRTKYTCCNNAKMCCGEGVCGACTARFEGHIVKRLCKLQTDPEYIFEGRRLI